MPQNVPTPTPQQHSPQAQADWPDRLMAALEIEGVTPDTARVARIARVAAAVSGHDDDGAVTAFIAGYAAGLAEGTGQAGFDRAHAASLRAIERLLAADVTARPAPGAATGAESQGTTGAQGPRP